MTDKHHNRTNDDRGDRESQDRVRLIDSQTLRSSIVVSFFTLLTGVFNYLKLVILAFSFGAGGEMDAFFAAITIPQIILSILLIILTTTFIPVFVETLARKESEAWKIASIASNLVFFSLVTLALIGSLFAREIISVISPGLSLQTTLISMNLFRFFILALVFSGSSIILTSLYHARQRFFAPSLAQFSNSFVTFMFVLLFHADMGVESIAVGTLAGSILQFVLVMPIMLRRDRYHFSLEFLRPEIRKLGRLMFPLLMGNIFYKTNILVERFIASQLGEGKISYLGYAYKIVMAMTVITSQGISTVLFPRMSQLSAVKDYKSLREMLSKGIRALTMFTVPFLLIIFIARYDLVRVIFERGNFGPGTTEAVANALLAYAGAFFIASISLPVLNTLYSLQETGRVAAAGVIGFSIYIGLAFLLSRYFSYLGIAMAVSIQYFINMIFIMYLAGKKLDGLELKAIFICAGKSFAAGGITGAILLLLKQSLLNKVSFPFDFLILGIVGFTLYLTSLILLKAEELRFFRINAGLKKDKDRSALGILGQACLRINKWFKPQQTLDLLKRDPRPEVRADYSYEVAQFHYQNSLAFIDKNEVPEGEILDLGCGYGGMSAVLKENFPGKIIGVDMEKNALLSARDFVKHVKMIEKNEIRFVLGNAEDLPFRSHRFGLIYTVATMEHFESPEKVLRECRRVLTGNGRLFITFSPFYTYNGAHLFDFINIPWCHLFFPEKTLVRVWKKLSTEKPEMAKLNSAVDPNNDRLTGINKISVRTFKKMIRHSELRVLKYKEKTFNSKICRILQHLPLFKELLTTEITLTLTK